MYWISFPTSIREITADEDKLFLSYKIYGGNLKGCHGNINKQYLDWMIEKGIAKIITNPLEAYMIKVILDKLK